MQLTSNTATPSSTNHTAWMMKPAKKKEQKKTKQKGKTNCTIMASGRTKQKEFQSHHCLVPAQS